MAKTHPLLVAFFCFISSVSIALYLFFHETTIVQHCNRNSNSNSTLIGFNWDGCQFYNLFTNRELNAFTLFKCHSNPTIWALFKEPKFIPIWSFNEGQFKRIATFFIDNYVSWANSGENTTAYLPAIHLINPTRIPFITLKKLPIDSNGLRFYMINSTKIDEHSLVHLFNSVYRKVFAFDVM